jgi:hypothetical protein
MKMIKKFFPFALLAAVVWFSACEDDDPVIPNEEEVITTMTYTLVPNGGGTTVVMSFRDLDGDGGDDPVITGGTLAANTTYSGSLELLNETETPVEVITEEIEEEDDEHQFFFQTDISGLSVSYEDQDGDGNPLGLATTLTTGSAASGSLTIILRHEPEKAAAGVADGDPTNAGGETDIEVSFSVDVQ